MGIARTYYHNDSPYSRVPFPISAILEKFAAAGYTLPQAIEVLRAIEDDYVPFEPELS